MPCIFASLRSQFTGSDWNVAAASGGSTTTGGTYYFRFSAYNRAGRNLLSAYKAVTWTTGQKVRWTINTSARQSGEEVFRYVLSAHTTTTEASAVQLAEWQAKDSDQVTNRSLPVTIDLTHNDHFVLSGTVANSAALPTNRINGMVRYITADSKYYRWDEEAVEGTYSAGGGYWVEYSGFSTYQSSTTATRGCDISTLQLEAANLAVSPPTYQGNGGDSTAIRLWLINGLEEDSGQPWDEKDAIAAFVYVNGDTSLGAALNGLVKFKFIGVVRRSTGVLDTSAAEVGTTYLWSSEKDALLWRLSAAVERGYAIVVEVYFSFFVDQLAAYIPSNANLQTLLVVKGRFGAYNPSGQMFGDIVLADGNKVRILPSLLGLLRMDGSVQVANYLAADISSQVYNTGLVADTANQKACIDAGLGGQIIVRQPSDSLLDTEAVRAVVSTEYGEATASGYSGTVTLSSGQILQLVINYPCTSEGVGTIRADYPDTKIRSNSLGDFNPPRFRLYIWVNGTIYRKDTAIAIVPDTSQTITIDSLTGTTVVGSTPTNGDTWFNFWDYGALTLSAISGGGSLGTGVPIKVAIAYYYPSGSGVVTKISHREEDGCIPELSVSLAELTSRSQYWGAAVNALTDLTPLNPTVTETRQVIAKLAPYVYNVGGTTVANADSVITAASGRWHQAGSRFYYDPVVTVSGLRSLPVGSIQDGEIRFVKSKTSHYVYCSGLAKTDNDNTYINPGGIPASGTWVKQYRWMDFDANDDGYVDSSNGDMSRTVYDADLDGKVDVAAGGTDQDFSSSTGFPHVASGVFSVKKSNLTATSDPTTSSDTAAGYAVGSAWVNTTTDKVFFCTDATNGAAVWIDASNAVTFAGNFAQFADQGSTPSTPTSGNKRFYATSTGMKVLDSSGNVFEVTAWKKFSTQTGNFTAIPYGRYPANTNGGAFTCTLPTSGEVWVFDVYGNSPSTGFGVNALTLSAPGGHTVMGASTMVLNVGAIGAHLQLEGTDWRVINGD